MGYRLWTTTEVRLLRETHPSHSTVNVAARLGRSVKSVERMAQRLSIKKKYPYRRSRYLSITRVLKAGPATCKQIAAASRRAASSVGCSLSQMKRKGIVKRSGRPFVWELAV